MCIRDRGAGFKMNVFSLDAAYVVATAKSNPLDQTLRFTLSFDMEDVYKRQVSYVAVLLMVYHLRYTSYPETDARHAARHRLHDGVRRAEHRFQGKMCIRDRH